MTAGSSLNKEVVSCNITLGTANVLLLRGCLSQQQYLLKHLSALISLGKTKGLSHSYINELLRLVSLVATGFNKEKCKGGLKNESAAPS